MMLRSIALMAASLMTADFASAQLVHRYSFAGTTSVVPDLVGNLPGQLMNGAVQAGGKLLLDGVDDYVSVAPGVLDGLTSITFEAWYTWTAPIVPNWPRIIDIGNSVGGAGQTYLVMSVQGSAPLQQTAVIKGAPAGSSERVFSGTSQQVNELVHLVWTIDGTSGQMAMYLNGVLTDSAATSYQLSQIVADNFWIGRSQFGTDPYFEGIVEEIRVHEGALSAAQVAESFAVGPDVLPGIGDPFCGALPNTTGQPGSISAAGSLDAAVNDLTLGVTGLPAGQFGIFVVSRTQGATTMLGQGILCLSGSIGRYQTAGDIFQVSAAGTTSFQVDLQAVPTPTALVGTSPGDTWCFQAWHRDVAPGGPGSNFTNGVELTFQ